MMTRRNMIQFSWKIGNTVLLLVLLAVSSAWASKTYLSSELGSRVISAVVLYIVILLTIGWLLFISNKWFRNRLFLMLGFAVLFVWGCVSYFCWPVDVEDGGSVEPTVTHQIQSVNRLLSCFFSGSLLETAPTTATRLNYEILHFVLIFYLGAWAFSLWGKGAVNRMRRHAILERHLNVFWEVNEQGLALAEDIVRKSALAQVEFNIPSTVFDADEGDAEIRRLDGLDSLWIAVDFNRLTKSHTRGNAHYFLSGSGERNMRLANALARFLPESESGEKKTFHIRIESSADEQMFSDWAEGLKKRVDIVLVREAEMIARQLMCDYPVLTTCPGITFDPRKAVAAGGVKLLVVGFDAVGWDVVEQMICNSRFSTDGGGELPFACTVVDSDRERWNEFKSYCPEAESCYRIEFELKSIADPDFPKWVAERISSFNRIVVCPADDGAGIELLSRIVRESRNSQNSRISPDDCLPRIFVRIADVETKECVEAVRRRHTQDGRSLLRVVRFFGCLDEIYRTSFLNYDVLYEIASVLNAHHKMNGKRLDGAPGWLNRQRNDERREIDRLWTRASFDDRLSSLSSAAGEWNAMLLMGYSIQTSRGVGGSGRDDELRKRLMEEELVDRLARNEHYRWNAWHRLRGYRTWDLENPPITGESTKKANKLLDFGRHAAIVQYDELPNVDLRIAQAISPDEAECISPDQLRNDGEYVLLGKRCHCMQYWDREFCRSIVHNIAAAGRIVCLRRGEDT